MLNKIILAVFLICVSFSALLACNSKSVSGENAVYFNNSDAQPTPPKVERERKVDSNEPIRIAAVGDIMLGSPFPNDSRMPPNDGTDLLKDVTPILSSADIAFGNLEGSMTDGGVSEKCEEDSLNCYAFRMPTRYGKYLKAAGFDVMSVANNHALDFGLDGQADTRATLDAQGIKHVGGNRAEFASAILVAKGKKIGFIGFAHNDISPNINELDFARRIVADLVKRADIVVVSFHGGAEGINAIHVPQRTEMFFSEKRGNLPLFARTVIDAGADLVLGHGPHVLRGMEIYNDRLIHYSLGNFATYGWFQLKGATAETMILEVKLDGAGKFLGGKIYPVKLVGRGIPVLDKSKSAIRTVRNLSITDFKKNAPKIADDGTISAK
jgi:hypothetical protein